MKLVLLGKMRYWDAWVYEGLKNYKMSCMNNDCVGGWLSWQEVISKFGVN